MEKNPKFYSVLISSNEVMKLQSLEYGVSDHGVHWKHFQTYIIK